MANVPADTDSRLDATRAAQIDRLYSTLVECLREQVDQFANFEGDQRSRIEKMRFMCALAGAGRAAFPPALNMLTRLRASPVELPVPGGWAEFTFDLWRDLYTIAYGWELDNQRLLKRVLRPGQQVIDVGAHIGLVTIYAAHLVGPTGSVLAIEPGPKNVPRLRENLIRNGIDRIAEVIAVALADHDGTADLFSDGDTAGTEYSLNSEQHWRDGPSCPTTVMTLDHLIRSRGLSGVDLVKIDVEGAELLVLRGARETLHRPEVSFLIELHSWAKTQDQVCRLLRDHGFLLYEVGPRLELIIRANEETSGLGHVYATRHRLADEPRATPSCA